jgi:hypothetical protein
MSLDSPTYLNSLKNNIRARPIPWDGAVRAGTITDNDLKKIKAVDKVRKEQRKQTVEAEVEAYRSLILGGKEGKSILESAAKRTDVIQYMLVLIGDLLNGMFASFYRCWHTRNLIFFCRCPEPTFSASRASRSVSTVATLAQSLYKHRGSYTPLHIIGLNKSNLKCFASLPERKS